MILSSLHAEPLARRLLGDIAELPQQFLLLP
jgi:hypothetical protein